MGWVYKRRTTKMLWICFTDGNGKTLRRSAGTSNLKEAQKVLSGCESRAEAQKSVSKKKAALPTVREVFEQWAPTRKGTAAQWENQRIRKHALPHIGDMDIAKVRPRHIRPIFTALIEAGYAPKTIYNVRAILRSFFNDARADEHCFEDPMVLPKGFLPALDDKDPEWRAGAVFEQFEVEQLVTDDRVPADRRMVNALLFLGAFRASELAALRFRDWKRDRKPLGAFVVSKQYSAELKREVPRTKTGVARNMPVHPQLAALLAEWRLSGWAECFGRTPADDDLIVPYVAIGGRGRERTGDPSVHRDRYKILDDLKMDLAALGLRDRRAHDTRRTFISLAREAGARLDVLKWATHGRPKRAIMDVYSELPWPLICAQIDLIKLDLSGRRGEVIALPQVVGTTQLLHSELQVSETKEKKGWVLRESNHASSISDTDQIRPKLTKKAEKTSTSGDGVRHRKTGPDQPKTSGCAVNYTALEQVKHHILEGRISQALELIDELIEREQ